MITRLTVRRFEDRDMADVLGIERASFLNDAWSREYFEKYIGESPALFLVAEAAGRVVGYIIGAVTRYGGEIGSLAVLPPYRGQHIATKLLRIMMRRLEQRGVSAARLTVRKDNKEAIDLYKKLGFVRAGIAPNYYDDGVAGVRMKVTFENVIRPGQSHRPSR
ncbi:MAG TPA: ribosomal protein S18-alanine N-acetyltransferase [Bryobacteraceae bacterium]